MKLSFATDLARIARLGPSGEPTRGSEGQDASMRKFAFLIVFLLGVGPASIGASGVAAAARNRAGVATGRAVACVGPSTASIADLSVWRGTTLIQKASVPGGSTFHFVLRPGTYVISNQGHPGQGVGSKPFRVRSGLTTHVVVRDHCK